MKLEGKSVLLVAPRFFQYELAIKRELESHGATVIYLVDRHFKSAVLRAMTTHLPLLTQALSDRYYSKRLQETDADFDLIFVINGQTMSRRILKALRRRYPKATFTLYLWDSLRNREGVKRILDLFDDRSTFDPLDAAQFGMRFRPLFYTRECIATGSAQRRFDLSFVGTCHSDRYRIVRIIERQIGGRVTFCKYLLLQAKWVYFLRRYLSRSLAGASINEFKFEPLSPDQVADIYAGSNVVIDIEHPGQVGLTMRTIEAIGMKKKLLTTNANIAKYDFFGPNILVLDRAAPNVTPAFLTAAFEDYPDQIYEKYGITGWLREVLRLEN
jgi:hypothetical protein